MSTNAFAISRRLVERGLDKKVADAVAEEIVTHADDNHSTKADIARLEGRINTLSETMSAQLRFLTTLVAGLYVGLALLVLDRLL